MTTVGRWSPNKVRARVLDGTWVSPAEELGGMVLLTPTSIAHTGTSATIGANGSVTFSAVTSLSLNGVFSADYDNYLITMRAVGNTASDVRLRMRVSGTDNSTASSYVLQYLEASGTSVAGARTTTDSAAVFTTSNTQRDGMLLHIFGPYLSQPTAMRTAGVMGYLNAYVQDKAATHNQSTSYDGFTLFHSSNNMTGLISVYGLVGA